MQKALVQAVHRAAVPLLASVLGVPAGGGTSPASAAASAPADALGGVVALSSDGSGSCALLADGGVACWGYGVHGELGDGVRYVHRRHGSPRAVGVVGEAGSGLLGGVRSVVPTGSGGYCALLDSTGVDCWGSDYAGALGDGVLFNGDSAVPVPVAAPGGSGRLTGVAQVVPGEYGECALLVTSSVDCWGYGVSGELGDGAYSPAGRPGSPYAVAVVGVGGTGLLSGVASLASDGEGYCALLGTGGVDCWGAGHSGELGDGRYYDVGTQGSAVPVAVASPAGSDPLSGVRALSGGYRSYCAVTVTGAVDCWGYGRSGSLGDGGSYRGGRDGAATPVAVLGDGGSGALSAIATVVSSGLGSSCALTDGGRVTCWGYGAQGQLGDGIFYTWGLHASLVPHAVQGPGGVGRLADVRALTAGQYGYCALLISGAVDCWGYGKWGELGNGAYYVTGRDGSAWPVPVAGVGGKGTLAAAASVVGFDGFCAAVGGGAQCWGNGADGALGNGSDADSAAPVDVVAGKGLATSSR